MKLDLLLQAAKITAYDVAEDPLFYIVEKNNDGTFKPFEPYKPPPPPPGTIETVGLMVRWGMRKALRI